MAEEKRGKKSRGIIRRILRWISLGLLTILLILSLVFQTPWKVVALLFIFIAACTVLPGRLRRWFWLGVGAVVIALIIWIFLPDDNEGWQPYRYNFEKELQKLDTQYSIPPERNAATIYNRLMERYDANDYYIFDLVDLDPNTFNNIFRNPWRSTDYPDVADSLAHIRGAIGTLVEISKTEQCMFPICDPFNFKSHDKNAALRRWARLLVIAINNDIAEARMDNAVQKISANLQMAKHLYQQPGTINFLNGMSIEKLAIQRMNKIIVENDVVDSHINMIGKTLPEIKNEWSTVFNKIFEFDTLFAKTRLTMHYEVNRKGRTRLSRDPLAVLRSNLSDVLQNTEYDNDQFKAQLEYIAYPSYFQKKRMKAKTILQWFVMPSDPEDAAEILDEYLERYEAMTDPNGTSIRPKPDKDAEKQASEPKRLL